MKPPPHPTTQEKRKKKIDIFMTKGPLEWPTTTLNTIANPQPPQPENNLCEDELTEILDGVYNHTLPEVEAARRINELLETVATHMIKAKLEQQREELGEWVEKNARLEIAGVKYIRLKHLLSKLKQ